MKSHPVHIKTNNRVLLNVCCLRTYLLITHTLALILQLRYGTADSRWEDLMFSNFFLHQNITSNLYFKTKIGNWEEYILIWANPGLFFFSFRPQFKKWSFNFDNINWKSIDGGIWTLGRRMVMRIRNHRSMAAIPEKIFLKLKILNCVSRNRSKTSSDNLR